MIRARMTIRGIHMCFSFPSAVLTCEAAGENLRGDVAIHTCFSIPSAVITCFSIPSAVITCFSIPSAVIT